MLAPAIQKNNLLPFLLDLWSAGLYFLPVRYIWVSDIQRYSVTQRTLHNSVQEVNGFWLIIKLPVHKFLKVEVTNPCKSLLSFYPNQPKDFGFQFSLQARITTKEHDPMHTTSTNLLHIGKQIQNSVTYVYFPQKVHCFTLCTTSLCLHMDTVLSGLVSLAGTMNILSLYGNTIVLKPLCFQLNHLCNCSLLSK